jgi:branched-chain amino acid transport system permease protein
MSAPQLLDLAILTLVWAGIAAAWNLLAGFAGQFSLGHAAFLGIGAYSAAVPAVRYGITPWAGMLVGVLLAGLLALLIASISLRMRGPFFTLLTIAFAEVVRLIALYAKRLTNGAEGIIIELKPGLANLYFLEKWPFVILGGVYALGMCVLCVEIRRSRMGHWQRAVRDDEDAARSLGVPVYRTRVIAAVISASCTAVGGSLLAMYTQFIDPDSTMSFLLSVEPALITIVGGLGHAWGPLFGAILIVPLERLLRGWFGGVLFGLHGVMFGLLLIVILLALPDGLLNAERNWRARWKERRSA